MGQVRPWKIKHCTQVHSLRESFVQVSCSKEESPTGADGREEGSLAQARDPRKEVGSHWSLCYMQLDGIKFQGDSWKSRESGIRPVKSKKETKNFGGNTQDHKLFCPLIASPLDSKRHAVIWSALISEFWFWAQSPMWGECAISMCGVHASLGLASEKCRFHTPHPRLRLSRVGPRNLWFLHFPKENWRTLQLPNPGGEDCLCGSHQESSWECL